MASTIAGIHVCPVGGKTNVKPITGFACGCEDVRGVFAEDKFTSVVTLTQNSLTPNHNSMQTLNKLLCFKLSPIFPKTLEMSKIDNVVNVGFELVLLVTNLLV